MKHVTIHLEVPDNKAEQSKAALEKDLRIPQQSLRLRKPATVSFDVGNLLYAAIFLTPDAIREHFGSPEEYTEDDDDHSCALALQKLPDEALFEAACDYLVSSDDIWEAFHGWCQDIIELAEKAEEKPKA